MIVIYIFKGRVQEHIVCDQEAEQLIEEKLLKRLEPQISALKAAVEEINNRKDNEQR